MVWDGSNTHSKSKVVKAWLARHPEVVAEDFPGYAPDLNPDEWVWGWAKCGRLSNLAALDANELWDHIVMAFIEQKFQPRLLKAFIEGAGLPMAA